MTINKKLRPLCESAILIAIALVLSYVEVPIGISFGGFGGSLSFVMIPLVLCAVRWGLGWGLGTGLAFGTLKFFLGGGAAINWESMLLDYSVAYLFVGFAGCFHHRSKLTWLAALVGCLARFVVHFVSGITVYAEYVSPIFGWDGSSSFIYSILYNGSYMLPNTILTVVLCLILQKPMKKLLEGQDLKKA